MTSSSSSSDLFIQKEAVPNQTTVPISISVLDRFGSIYPQNTRNAGTSVSAKAAKDIILSIVATINKLKE
ncbi:hypothetical protein C8N25_101409 [Algoriphagus antarcticus]|uniref:Uncharacterized protein n=1 Tax=Algoriphagus antarcticus TaxID=238540 RepID=A0A3E0EC36_9BACT|nr:hypothetical protein C8N25_101409 [Algoriphagus antarcticus]